MSSAELDRLVDAGSLKREPPVRTEFEGLVASGARRLDDALRTGNSIDGRFDLVYNASHALALAALRWHGYRPGKRYIVFPALAHTLEIPAEIWRVLARGHQERNQSEYEGVGAVNESLVRALIEATQEVLRRVRDLPALPESPE